MENQESEQESEGLESLCNAILIPIAYILAFSTVWTHTSQFLAIPFRTYAVGIATGVVFGLGIAFSRIMVARRKVQSRFAASVLLCAAAGACLMSMMIYRPTGDMPYYISNPVAALSHPNEPMGFEIRFVDSGTDEPLRSYHVCTAMSSDYLEAAITYFTGVPFLVIYCVLWPGVWAFMLPLIWFLAISKFGFRPVPAVVGSILVCLTLTMMYDSLFGYVAFCHFMHAKSAVYSLGVPWLIALAINLFRSPSLSSWTNLFAFNVAMTGLSSNSVMFLPLAGLHVYVAYHIAYPAGWRNFFARAWVFGTAFVYMFPVVALYAATNPTAIMQAGNAITSDFTGAFDEQFMIAILRTDRKGPIRYVSLGILVSTFLASLMYLKGRLRILIVSWLLFAVLFFLNPVVAAFLSGRVIPAVIYHRLYFLLPFPLALGLVVASLFSSLRSRKTQLLSLVSILIFTIALHAMNAPGSMMQRSSLEWFKVDIRPSDAHAACRVLDVAPPGTMLSPQPLCYTIPMFSGHHPQLVLKGRGIHTWMISVGMTDRAESRVLASQYLAGGEGSIDDLIDAVGTAPRLRTIVARRKVADNQSFSREMKLLGFVHQQDASGYVVFWR